MASFKIGQKDFIINFFTEEVFNSFTPFKIADLENSTECLVSIDAENATAIDKILAKAKAAGGDVTTKLTKKMAGCMATALPI